MTKLRFFEKWDSLVEEHASVCENDPFCDLGQRLEDLVEFYRGSEDWDEV